EVRRRSDDEGSGHSENSPPEYDDFRVPAGTYIFKYVKETCAVLEVKLAGNGAEQATKARDGRVCSCGKATVGFFLLDVFSSVNHRPAVAGLLVVDQESSLRWLGC
ncbi:hypothetical protein MRX96_046564, partial [Rhipicephalus microplus]